jgi:hypothetical protein
MQIQTKQQKQFENPLGFLHKQSIIEVVAKANRLISPNEIQKELIKLNENSGAYQIGENWNWKQIKNNRTEDRYLPSLTLQKIEEKSQQSKNVITIRTIQTHCKELVNEKIFEHKYNRYMLTDKAKSNLLNFSMMFGKYGLLSLMENMKLSDLDHDNLHDFINIFGSFIIFAFIEATRKQNNDEKLIHNWLENAIPLRLMFDYFISVFTDEATLKEKIKNKSSLYEFNNEKINMLSKALKITNPDVYQILSETKKSIIP